ncbi:hypothetical protein [Runella zeae]|uniref:hypothetical protein n=1 Tax=Runella zeae TaxID=94255 RepID=UPI00042A0D68|nr:hypothetical protein [Runella zeae]
MKPHVIELNINNNLHRYTGPRCWNDLSKKQYEKLFKVGNVLTDKPHSLFALPEILFKIPPTMLNYLFDKDAMSSIGIIGEDDQDATIQLGNSLLELCQNVARSQAPDKWFLDCFKHKEATFWGPQDRLANLDFEEFWFTEAAYESGNYDELVSILYCANGKKIRAPFSEKRVIQSEKFAKSLSTLEKQMIAFNYEGCRLSFRTPFPNVFKTQTEAQKKKSNSSSSWLQIAIGMAEDKSLEFESLKRQNLLVALQMLESKIVKAKELQKKLKNTPKH